MLDFMEWIEIFLSERYLRSAYPRRFPEPGNLVWIILLVDWVASGNELPRLAVRMPRPGGWLSRLPSPSAVLGLHLSKRLGFHKEIIGKFERGFHTG